MGFSFGKKDGSKGAREQFVPTEIETELILTFSRDSAVSFQDVQRLIAEAGVSDDRRPKVWDAIRESRGKHMSSGPKERQ